MEFNDDVITILSLVGFMASKEMGIWTRSEDCDQ